MSDDDEPMPYRIADLPEGIVKEVIKEHDSGEWRSPKKGDDVTVHYVGTLEDGTEFDSSRSRGEPITFTIGIGQVIKGWEKGIATMRKGEIAKLIIQPEFAYGEAGQPPKIPPKAVLTFEVEVVSILFKNDVFRDGNAIKTVQEEGKGYEEPHKGEEVKFSLKVVGKDNEVLLEYVELEYTIESMKLEPDGWKNEVIAKLADKVISGMKLEEKCLLKCAKDYILPGKGETDVFITLHEIHKTSDVSFLSDGTVMKKQINNIEEHEKPQDGHLVTLRVEAATDENKSSLPGFSGPKEVKFRLGSGEACDALEAAAADMKKGEIDVITCTVPSKCVDKLMGLSEIKAEKVILKLLLIDFEKNKKELWSLSGEEKMMISLERKEMGGKLFKEKRFELALQKYKKVTEMMNQTDSMSKDCKARAGELKHIAEMNKAACFLQLGDPTSALSICNTILQADRNNVKALLRRAKAHFSRGEHSNALRDLDRVLELEPETEEAKTLIPKIKRAQKVADKESKDAYSKMVEGLSKVGFGKENKKPEVKPAPKEEPREEQDPEIVTVAFRIDKKLEPGEHIYVVGQPEQLGAWDIEKGVKMKRIPGPPDYEALALGKTPKETNLWEAVVELPQSLGRTEYRYAARRPSGDEIEEGQKHVMQLSGMGGSRMRCGDEWRERCTYVPREEGEEA